MRGGAERIRLTLRGEEPIETGSGEAVAPSTSRIVDADGRSAGTMDLSVTDARSFADLLASVTDMDVVLTENGQGDRRHGRDRRGPAGPDGRQRRDRRRELPRDRHRDAGVRRRHAGRPGARRGGRAPGRDLREHARHLPDPRRVPDLRRRVRADRRALAAAPDHAPARRRPAHRQGRLLRRGPDGGQRRVRRARQGVQQDGAPARGPAGGAAAGTRAAAGDRPARRRLGRQGPRSRRDAGHRRADGGRRRGGGVRPRGDPAGPERDAVGGRASGEHLVLHVRGPGGGGGRDAGRQARRDADRRRPRARPPAAGARSRRRAPSA